MRELSWRRRRRIAVLLLVAVVGVGIDAPARADGPPYDGVMASEQCVVPNYATIKLEPPRPADNCDASATAQPDGSVAATIALTTPDGTETTTVGWADAMVTRDLWLTELRYSMTFSVTVHVHDAWSNVIGPAEPHKTMVFSWTAVEAAFSHLACSDCEISRPVMDQALTASFAPYGTSPVSLTDHVRTVMFTVHRRSGLPIPVGPAAFSAGVRAYAYDGSNGQWGYDNLASSSVTATVLDIS